jgi:hypothetical protein
MSPIIPVWPFAISNHMREVCWRVNFKIKDTYEIRIEDDTLDIRVSGAIGVAVDAFMNR